MAANRRQPTKDERESLRCWLELAALAPGAPVPEHVAELARGIARLVFSQMPAKKAAAHAAVFAGLTGRAIADFRAEQTALLSEMAFEFNRGQPTPDKSTVVASFITDVGERQVYRRLKRSR